MLTSTAKFINHKGLILALLDVIQLPAKVAICKWAAHTKTLTLSQTAIEEQKKKLKKKKREEEPHKEINHQVLCDVQKAAPQIES